MNFIKRIFHFSGSITFTILLISTVATLVIAGTFLEAGTDSHRYASFFTYGNPIFTGLLWGFFINILVSALRRWPFKPRHVPFLITHVGLLMILGGTLMKSYGGTQGAMGIMEGSASEEVMLSGTYAVLVETRDPSNSDMTIKSFVPIIPGKASDRHETQGLQIELLEYSPHASESYESWIKGNVAFISGLHPFAVHSFKEKTPIVPEGIPVRLAPEPAAPWNIVALITEDTAAAAEQSYVQPMTIRFLNTFSSKTLWEGPLRDALKKPIAVPEFSAVIHLQLNFDKERGFDSPALTADISLPDQAVEEKMSIPLAGTKSLNNLNLTTHYLGSLPITIELQRIPSLVFVQDKLHGTFIFTYDAFGRVHSQLFKKAELGPLVVYDQAFGGYAVQAPIPFSAISLSRQQLDKMKLEHIANDLRLGIQSANISSLAPPLQTLREACLTTETDFAECCSSYLDCWNKSHSWLYPEELHLPQNISPAIAAIDWAKIPASDKKACCWSCSIFKNIEGPLKQGEDLINILRLQKWPLVNSLESIRKNPGRCTPEEMDMLLTALVRQVFSVGGQLPEYSLERIDNARLLSAYLRAYGIHLSLIDTPEAQDPGQGVTLESPLTARHETAKPLRKLEDNQPMILLKLTVDGISEYKTLVYDKYGTGLKWPAMGGRYLLRFQPLYSKIPYHVRLRHARQINYPGTTQPYSFESDLIVRDTKKNTEIEKTISMNNVHETWDGYRFYLANITPADQGAVKHVQIVVNHDPAKYWLTYPGAIIMVLGIILLFWLRPYHKRH